MFTSIQEISKKITRRLLRTPTSRRVAAILEAEKVLGKIQKDSKTNCAVKTVRGKSLVLQCPNAAQASELRFFEKRILREIKHTRIAITRISYCISSDSKR